MDKYEEIDKIRTGLSTNKCEKVDKYEEKISKMINISFIKVKL